MKLAVASVLSLLASSTLAGPFGFEQGQTLAELEAKVGKLDRTDEPTVFRSVKAPVPLKGIEAYGLLVGKETGLCKVVGLGQDIATNDEGHALQAAYAELKAALTKKYGEPTMVAESLAEGSIWDEPKDFMMGLKLGERRHGVIWSKVAAQGLATIVLQAEALNPNTGFLRLSYEFPNFKACVAAKDELNPDAL